MNGKCVCADNDEHDSSLLGDGFKNLGLRFMSTDHLKNDEDDDDDVEDDNNNVFPYFFR